MTFLQTVKRFFEPMMDKPLNFILCGFIALLGALHSLSYAWYFQKMIEAIEDQNQDKFYFWLIILLSTVIGWFVIRMFDRRFYFKASQISENYIYKKYITHFFVSDNTQVDRIGKGRIMTVLNAGIKNRTLKLVDFFWFNLNSIFVVIISLYIIGSKSIYFFGSTIIILIFLFFWIKLFGSKALIRRERMKDVGIERDKQVLMQINSKFEIVQSNKIYSEILKYKSFTDDILFYRGREKLRQGIAYDGSNLMVGIFRMIVIGIVGYSVLQNSLNISEVMLFVILTGILVSSISELSVVGRNLSDALVHIEKFRNMFDSLDIDHKWDVGENFSYHIGNIIIDNISFSYISGKHIFNNFSLELKGGTKIALVGESGGGKTTLIKLLAGYLKPDNGEVVIDGQRLSEVKLTDYYRHIGYLTQDPSVFDGTVWENLTYALEDEKMERGKEDKIEKDIHEIIKLAKCEFIYNFEDGLQTEIGERGVRLSGGQKQRLAIAKIMLKNPNIILLDEPTSALDSFNEELVSEALNNLFAGRTVIVVAHRLQTVKNADRIIYIGTSPLTRGIEGDYSQIGSIILEDGTHEELIKKNGKYKKMLDLQSGF